MAEPAPDVVRRYNPETDAKTVKMLVGQGVMEGLAYANQRVSRHPLVLVLWVILALALDYKVDWLPQPNSPLSYAAPLIGFAVVMVPILGFAEFMHRPVWTRLLREKVGSPDMIAMDAFYNIEPKSTMLVFEHKGEVSGVVALDGKKATQSLGTVLGAEEKQVGDVGAMERAGLANREGLRRRKGEESDFAQIRHLDVDHPVRRVGVATELLTAALDHAFKNVEKVVVMTNPFSPGGEKVFTRCGFKPVPPAESSHWEQPQAVGLFKWKGRWLAVTREDWVARRSVVSS